MKVQSKNPNADVESGIPIQAHENAPVYSGVAGLRE